MFNFFFFFSPERTFRRNSCSSRGHAGIEQEEWPGGASRGCFSSCVSTWVASRDTEPCRDEAAAGADTDSALSRHRSRITATSCHLASTCSVAIGTPLRDRVACSSGLGGGGCGVRVSGRGSGRRARGCRRSAPLCPQTPRLAWPPSKKLKTFLGSPPTPRRTSSWCEKTGRRVSWPNSPPSSSFPTTCGPAIMWM